MSETKRAGKTVTGVESSKPSSAVRILLIEDSDRDAELALSILKRSGQTHSAQRVQTEDELRTALKDFRPHVILSDVDLPAFDGHTALKIAKALAPRVPFIFVSGVMGEERAIDSLHEGAVDYVLKSNLARLAPAVERAVAEAARRERQDALIAQLDRTLRLNSSVNATAIRIHDRAELLRETCRLAVSVGGYAAAVACAKIGGNTANQPIAWHGIDPALAEALRTACAAAASDADGAPVRAMKMNETWICHEPKRWLEENAPSNASPAAELSCIIALPISIDGTILGSLWLTSREVAGVEIEELRMLQDIAGSLSFALQYLQKDTMVRFLSRFDPHTGLAKRSLFFERLTRALSERRTPRAQLVVVVFDIERLGLINDSFGRRTGDTLLQHVAARLKKSLAHPEDAGHFGGGTFALMRSYELPSAVEALQAAGAATMALFEEPYVIEQRSIPLAVRSGLALYPTDGANAESVLQHAEAALLHARASGQRQLHYSAQGHTLRLDRMALEHRLRLALERRQFELHYQPKVNVITRRIQGAEALIRWRDPMAGLVSPAAFLPALESAGLGADVGGWVISQAARDCQQWRHAGLPPVRIAVNVSPAHLLRSEFARQFLDTTQPWSNTLWGLDIEVTEGALHEDSGEEIQKLRLLRRSGVRVAIDDFGTGYSSLQRLASLPVDTLKIDSHFINQIPAQVSGKALVKTIIALARTFNMTTVAEGVEKQQQLDFLWQVGCDQSQGYLHSKPIPCQEFAVLLQHGSGHLIRAALSEEEVAAEDNAAAVTTAREAAD